jgi:hypothetical protein|tara:strand:- start:344 stop:544 length:201 start_codon:yes stop_codon:yes gene_type:complete
MAFRIEKISLGNKIYYQGNLHWTDKFDQRKSYETNALAQHDLDDLSEPTHGWAAYRPQVTGTIVEE